MKHLLLAKISIQEQDRIMRSECSLNNFILSCKMLENLKSTVFKYVLAFLIPQPLPVSYRNESEMVQQKDPDISKPTLHRSVSIEMKQLDRSELQICVPNDSWL